MRFSKKKFLKIASAGIKRQLKNHLDILDGIEVTFDGKYGQIPKYFVDGRGYYLYPIDKNWCV